MSQARGPADTPALAKAARELAELQGLAGDARSMLAGLLDEVAAAQTQLASSQAAQLVEVNEHLILGMLKAQAEAEASSRALEAVSQSAELDALTGVPNRARLLDRLTQAMANAKRRGTHLAVLFLDLNNFKAVNDTLGHGVGDEVLKTVASRIAASIREADTVSRHGGDEFLVLLNDLTHTSDAVLISDKLNAALGVPFLVNGHELRMSASIGISIFPDDGDDPNALIGLADAAMYRAKRLGWARCAFHGQPAMAGEGPPNTAMVRPQISTPEVPVDHHNGRHADLCEANTQLVLAALSAQESQAAAEHAHRKQTEFLAVLAHELRNPLAPIRTAAALLARVTPDELPRMQTIIQRQVSHLTRLIGDLLDMSRVNTGKLRLDCKTIDMADVLASARDTYRTVMQARDQRFTVDVPQGKLEMHGDGVRLTQVISNLLDNASKYTPRGGEIGLSVVTTSETLVITVSDNGIGITAAALPHIFDVFVQDKLAVGFNLAGLGIGLTVVRELVEAHGGTVVAASDGAGCGSRFIVTLPWLPAPPAPHASER